MLRVALTDKTNKMNNTPNKKRKFKFVHLAVLLAGLALPAYAYAQTCDQCFNTCNAIYQSDAAYCNSLPPGEQGICLNEAGMRNLDCHQACIDDGCTP